MNDIILSRITPRLLQVVATAQRRAQEKQESIVCLKHLLFALLIKQRNLMIRLLETNNVEIKYLPESTLKMELKNNDSGSGNKYHTSERMESLFELAFAEAKALGKTYIGVEHIMLAWLKAQENGQVPLPALLPSSYIEVRKIVENERADA